MAPIRSIAGIALVLGFLASPAGAGGPSRFVVPKSKDEWSGRRPRLVKALREAVGVERRQAPVPAETKSARDTDLIRHERFVVRDAAGYLRQGSFAYPPAIGGSKRIPCVLLLADRDDLSAMTGINPVDDLVRRGMGVMTVEFASTSHPWDEPTRWPWILRDDQIALEILTQRPEVDPSKIAVLGIGPGGTRAVWLAALDERVKVCIAISGMTRLADWAKAHPDRPVPPWMATVMDGMDLEALVALCAGRPFSATAGDRDTSCPVPGVQVVEETGRAMDRLVGDHHFSITRLGRQDEHYNRLPWMGAMETLDKAFFPQGPTALGHAPEPEPEVTSEFVDLAPAGIAGWAVEMSQRPTTWTWKDGVISCKPGPNEYGWLRAPVEVGDFVLALEWKVQRGGNSGVFLRARPVPWTFPPSTANKRLVSTLGLDWPSRTGLELQAQDDPGVADKYSSGSLYRHAGVAANPTNPPGQWNHYTVRARGPRVEVWSNGRQVLDARIDQCPLTLPNPPMRGYIGLQNHGAPAEFRNIKLLRLSE